MIPKSKQKPEKVRHSSQNFVLKNTFSKLCKRIGLLAISSLFVTTFLLIIFSNINVSSKNTIDLSLYLAENSSLNASTAFSSNSSLILVSSVSKYSSKSSIFSKISSSSLSSANSSFVNAGQSSVSSSFSSSSTFGNFSSIFSSVLADNSHNNTNSTPNLTNSGHPIVFVTNTIKTGGFGSFLLILTLLILCIFPIIIRRKNSKISITSQNKIKNHKI